MLHTGLIPSLILCNLSLRPQWLTWWWTYDPVWTNQNQFLDFCWSCWKIVTLHGLLNQQGMSWAAEGHLSTSRLRMKVTQGKAELKDEETEMRFDDVVWAPESSHVWSPSFYSWTSKFPFCVYASFDWFSVSCSWNYYGLYKLFCAFFTNEQELLYFSILLIWKWRPSPFVIRCFTSHKIQSLFAPFCLGMPHTGTLCCFQTLPGHRHTLSCFTRGCWTQYPPQSRCQNTVELKQRENTSHQKSLQSVWRGGSQKKHRWQTHAWKMSNLTNNKEIEIITRYHFSPMSLSKS